MSLDTRQNVEQNSKRSTPVRCCFLYGLYGVTLRSQWKLPYTACAEARPPVIELVEGSPDLFEQAAREASGARASQHAYKNWFQYSRLADGAAYLRWPGLYEFVISTDGCRVNGRPSRPGIPPESFHTYLLGMALSVSLIRLGVDPLHANVVAAKQGAFGFLGKTGYGKSTLAAAFLQTGYSVVTDDLLVPKRQHQGYAVYPGPPRIKLLPEVAETLLGGQAAGVPMNPLTRKLILPLNPRQSCPHTATLRALYLLNDPGAEARSIDKIRIRRLSPRGAVLALLEHTFNDLIEEPARLRQQFVQYSQIASRVPVNLLSYPRRLDALDSVRDAIVRDLGR